MKYNRQLLIDAINSGETFEYIGFWGIKNINDPYRVLSNFYYEPFTVDMAVKFPKLSLTSKVERTFDCNEQYFMLHKAIEFNDAYTADLIMKRGKQAKTYKTNGRNVRNFDRDRWHQVSYNCMLDGLREKFTQNEELKQFLLGTGNAVLVETSPYDDLWGIKMNKLGSAWKRPKDWRGENWLGFALMEVRDELRA